MESSDSFTSSSSTSSKFAAYHQYEGNKEKTQSLYHSSLHAIRRAPLKPMKKPIAPLPPTKPKVYRVDSMNFKQVVQRLTSAPEFQPSSEEAATGKDLVRTLPQPPAAFRQRRLEEVAPPALDLSTTALPLFFPAANQVTPQVGQQFLNSPNGTQITTNFSEIPTAERKQHKLSETCGAQSPLGFSFSPSSLAWCLSPLLSPGTHSFMD